MKRHLIAITLIFCAPLFLMAQELEAQEATVEYEKLGEKYEIHDSESKVDFQLMRKDEAHYLKVWINTHTNLGCIDTADYIILYLDNGNDVDLIPEGKNCGALAENKKHSDYELVYLLPEESVEQMMSHKVEYFELEAEHGTIERKAESFQDISKEHFENYFMKNLKKEAKSMEAPKEEAPQE